MTSETEEHIVNQFVDQLNEQFQALSEVQLPHASGTGRGHRELFTITRQVAACTRNEQPDESEFHPVLCRDLSSAGMSFWVNECPVTEWFAVKFEINTAIIAIRARVVRVNREFDLSKPPFLVECEFQGRFATAKADSKNKPE